MNARLRDGLLLVLLASLALAVTLAWRDWTAPTLAEAERQLQHTQWLAALPPGSYDNDPLLTPISLPNASLRHSQLLAAYRATLAGKPTAVLLRSKTQGYAGSLVLSIAIAASGRLIGIHVLEQQETPGLGGQLGVPQPPWLEQFDQRDLNAGWALKRDQGDFDQLTGATVTSRAVIDALQDALRYFDEHRTTLLQEAADE
ncbi:RnfABCDGE type electron transport complex subunit G [Pseudomonas entomophila]|uniref:RnfABCDGE type electron transport complex subunit G n=1 Tax=Pseudomonas entomophila TaxID=312306 RepID=UPI0023D85660|nr:RnfABCDGE type electron transport complex subunit G [Pseudomonas entomophila]MDF0731196.1 RnfABCDGE type electron transport complex subunit G [Pseudomonas entomophila]